MFGDVASNLGQASRVRDIEVLDRRAMNHKRDKFGPSNLLIVRIHWVQPTLGMPHVNVVAGHLHKTTAKAHRSDDLKRFWDKLSDSRAGGARVLGLDLDMSMFGLSPEMLNRGVGATLMAHHMVLDQPDKDPF